MLLFFGTPTGHDTLDEIFASGISIARGGPYFAHALTGAEHVFLSTAPVAGTGGDPVAAARDGSGGRRRGGAIVVIELAEADRGLIAGAIANSDLARWFQVLAFRRAAELDTMYGLAMAARQRGTTLRDMLTLTVGRIQPGLVEGEPDPHRLLAFGKAYPDAPLSRKAEIAAGHGVRLPDDYARDSHYQICALCLAHLYSLMWTSDVPDPRSPDRVLQIYRHFGDPAELDLETIGFLAERAARWVDTIPPAEVAMARRRSRLEWKWLAGFEPPRDQVPRAMWPDFTTVDLARRMNEPDTQLLLTAVPARCIVGAISIGDGGRLPSTIRPGDGETLAGNLWRVAREMRAAWRGRPLRR